MNIRMQPGTLAGAMRTAKQIEPTKAAVCEYLLSHGWDVDPSKIHVLPYQSRPDTRIGWEQTYVVGQDRRQRQYHER